MPDIQRIKLTKPDVHVLKEYAQRSVGVQVQSLLPEQKSILLLLLLHKAGAISRTGSIKPLRRWV